MSENKEMSPKTKIALSPKAKKIINIVVDVVCGVVLVIALILAVSMINTRRKGYKDYTEIFGTAYLAVQTDSMKPVFSSGDLIKIKTITAQDAKKLKEGDIITFKDRTIVNGQYRLNTHRIKSIGSDSDGMYFITHGDNNPESMNETVLIDDVVGLYKSKTSGIGNVFMFMGTSAGFFVFVVLPTLIIVVIAAVNFAMVFVKEKKAQKELVAQAQLAAEQEMLDERERIRQELLAEMQAQAAKPADAPPAEDAPPADAAPTEEVASPAEESKEEAEETPSDKEDK